MDKGNPSSTGEQDSGRGDQSAGNGQGTIDVPYTRYGRWHDQGSNLRCVTPDENRYIEEHGLKCIRLG